MGVLPGDALGVLPMPLTRLPLQAGVSSHSTIPARPERLPPPRPSGVWEGLQSWLPAPPGPPKPGHGPQTGTMSRLGFVLCQSIEIAIPCLLILLIRIK